MFKWRWIYILLIACYPTLNAWGYVITKFPSQNLCVSAFPTAWVSGSFSVAESAIDEFYSANSFRTLQFDVPAGWEYNTAGGTYSVTGADGVDISSITNINVTASRISFRVNIDFETVLNTITVNCQIRATAAGVPGIIRRSGGNMKIAGSNKKPTSAESLGDLYAQAQMVYVSCTSAQTNTLTVSTNTVDNDIMRVEVVVTGTCNTFNVTQLDFTTTGSTAPGLDITTAKVYYTGTVASFSPSGLFGTFASPNGAFSVTGSQVLSQGTNYFWLTYDIPASPPATVNNLVDATCTSVVMDGGVGAKTPTTTAPAGSRKIYVLIDYYSVATGVWNDNNNWSLSDGGPACGCQPNGSGNVFINTNHTITLDATRTIDFLTIRNGATLQDAGGVPLTINNNFNTIGSGKITSASNISIAGLATFNGTGASTTTADFLVSQSATIGTGTSLTANGTAGNDIIIQGNLFLDGTLSSGASGATIIMNGAAAQSIDASSTSSIGGTGDLVFSTSAKTISSISTFSVNPTIAISGVLTVTNNGTVTVTGSITGTAGGSTWTNNTNSVLKIAGATLLTTGTLNASASPNTVEYNAAGNQTIKNTTYHNLILSQSGTKTFAGNATINFEMTMSGSVIGIVGTNTLGGAGGLTMSGTTELRIARTAATQPELTGAYGLTGGTITLNQAGGTTQTANGTPIYYNLKLDGQGAGSVYDLSAVTDVNNDLEFAGQAQSTISSASGLLVGRHFLHNTSQSTTLAGEVTVRGNWTNNSGTFNHGSQLVRLDGSTASQTIGGTNSTTFHTLILDNSFATAPQFVVGVNTVVTNTLTLTNGITNLSGNTLTLGVSGSASTLNRTASTTTNWLYGGTFSRFWRNGTAVTSNSGNYYGLYPMGESTASSYSPFEINSTASPTADGSLSVLYTAAPNSAMTLSPYYNDAGTDIMRIHNSSFQTNVAGITGGTYTVSATMTGLNPVGVLGDIRLAIFTGGTTASVVGTHAASTGTNINPTAYRTGVSIADLTAKDFRIASSSADNTPLPVQFLKISADWIGDDVEVNWVTEVEFNTDYFIVQRSSDGIQFDDVATVAAAGNSSTVRNYSAIDHEPFLGISYYRLKQFDRNGAIYYSSIIALNSEPSLISYMGPNPASEELFVSVSGSTDQSIRLSILDFLGRVLYTESFTLSSDSEEKRILLPKNLSAGIYSLVLRGDRVVSERKLTVIR